jgi:hypothetical protein
MRNASTRLRRVLEAWTDPEHTCSHVGWNGLTLGIQLEKFRVRYMLQQYQNSKLSPPRRVEVEEAHSRVAVSAETPTYAPEFYKPAKWAFNVPSALVSDRSSSNPSLSAQRLSRH